MKSGSVNQFIGVTHRYLTGSYVTEKPAPMWMASHESCSSTALPPSLQAAPPKRVSSPQHLSVAVPSRSGLVSLVTF